MFNTNMFTHVVNKKFFIGEISDLGPRPFRQIYPDSCDEGLTLISENTGNKSDWVIYDFKYNDDNELLVIRLMPTLETTRKFPKLKGYRMAILND